MGFKVSLRERFPEAEWVSFAERIGVGDGKMREFRLPFGQNEHDGLQFTENGYAIPDQECRIASEGDVSTVTFERAPAMRAPVAVSAFGREDSEVAFRLYPKTQAVENEIRNRMGKNLARKIDQASVEKEALAKLEPHEVISFYLSTWQVLVAEWKGIDDDDTKKPLECTDASKKAFLEQVDVMDFVPWAIDRATRLAKVRIHSRATELEVEKKS